MVDGRYNSAFKRKNIRQLRRALKMTQKEFIDYFLSNSDNKPSMSIATLSNLESRGGERVNEVVSSVCTKLQIDTMLFSLSTEEFIKEIEKYLAEHKDNEELVRGIEKKGSISKLVNRLTMYFADEMLEGRLKRGDQIESDRELARKLGVGRSAVRESLKVLDVLGMIDIRHYLNEYLTQVGGNIGYSVRKTERNKGYAKQMFKLALEKCKGLKIKKVLITCDEDNIASEKVILSANAKFEDIRNIDGENKKRFWIDL